MEGYFPGEKEVQDALNRWVCFIKIICHSLSSTCDSLADALDPRVAIRALSNKTRTLEEDL